MANTFKKLYQGQLAISAGTVYTVPASTSTVIKAWRAVNTSNAVVTFQLFQGGTATANAITPTLTIQAGGFTTEDTTIILGAADTIAALASVATTVNLILYGMEVV